MTGPLDLFLRADRHESAAGQLDLVVSPALLAELRRTLAYPKLKRLVSSADPGDDYLRSLLTA